ncbi:hypothetical protein [Lactiplantibacillus plantarum]|nr:hypothetical protein [Lactiplantibacillus plantarum]KPN42020.1 hypothetical protein WJL_2571 [Lactiplantibacillus plantarum WJL]MBF9193110.1 hypothetical protein [Lactiplantibacillus plantarum]MDO8176594.1 hypothetical protein [Lactiplantibacillus plantarum]GFF01283.1 hypothetical protein DmLsi_30860 [Lactiplantibacillus plantarum]
MLQKDIMDKIQRLSNDDQRIILDLVKMIEQGSKNNQKMRDIIQNEIEQLVMKERQQ